MQVKLRRAPLLRSQIRSRIEELNHAAPHLAATLLSQQCTPKGARIASSFWNAQAAEPNVEYHSSGINIVNSKPIVASRKLTLIFLMMSAALTTFDQIDWLAVWTGAAGD
jgi:hypothetical protein